MNRSEYRNRRLNGKYSIIIIIVFYVLFTPILDFRPTWESRNFFSETASSDRAALPCLMNLYRWRILSLWLQQTGPRPVFDCHGNGTSISVRLKLFLCRWHAILTKLVIFTHSALFHVFSVHSHARVVLIWRWLEVDQWVSFRPEKNLCMYLN